MHTTKAGLEEHQRFGGGGLVALALALCAASVARAQTPDSVWVAGTVVDSAGAPVPAAQVFVEPNSRMVLTDSLGRFLTRAAVGPALLIVRRIGYEAFAGEAELEAGRDRRFRIVMRPVALQLDAVETVAPGRQYRPEGAPASLEDFYRRRARGFGRTFTRDEIERLGSVRAVMATVPGIRVESDVFGNLAGIRVPRCASQGTAALGTDDQGMPTFSASVGGSAVAWFVDGFRTLAVPELRDQDIEAIEVYRGSSSLPPEAVGNACAAVMIWTRRSP